jgi:hypothetical protein
VAEVAHYYWDTCIFVAFLNRMQDAYGVYIEHIGQFLEEARKGECRIYTSGITIAEMPRKRLLASRYGDFNEFLADYAGAVTTIGADPNVMALAADIKNLTYTKTGGTREVGTADAVHLASALALMDDYGVPLTIFHTFDNGKGKGPEGRAVPLLSYQEWCEGCLTDPVAQRIMTLTRKRPDHPFPKLPMPLPIASKLCDGAAHPALQSTMLSSLQAPSAGEPDVVNMSLLASIMAKKASLATVDEPLALAAPAQPQDQPDALEPAGEEEGSDAGLSHDEAITAPKCPT